MDVASGLSVLQALGLALVCSCGDSSSPPVPPDQLVAPESALAVESPYPPLPKQSPCAGIDGFRLVYDVRFAAAQDVPHQLEVTQIFPARAHWCLSYSGPAGLSRVIDLQAGETAWHQADGSKEAFELTAAERADFERRNALRKALVVWPEGIAWQTTVDPNATGMDEMQQAALPMLSESEALGSLVVWIGADGRPNRAAVLQPLGAVQEDLRGITWKAHDGRLWPAAAELWVGGERVWTESLLSASVKVAFMDAYFWPRAVKRPSPGH
jgi:hypothetical protein